MALTLTIPGGSVQLSANPIWCTVLGGVVPAGATDYKLLVKVTSLDGVLAGGPFVDAVSPDVSGKAVFNISGYVDQPIPVQFEWPLVTAVKAYIDAAYNIKIEFGERYINSAGVLVETYAPASQNIQILKGGISDLRIGEYNDLATSFYAEMILKGKFLTNQPNNTIVAPKQPVKLYMVSPYLANTNMVLYITGRYADGTAEMFTQVFEFFRDGLFEFNVMPYHVGLPMTNAAGSKMVSYSLAIVNPADGSFGESRTFRIDNNYYENSNFLFAANSYGCVDVIWLTGELKITTEITGTEGVRPMRQGATARTHTVLTTSKSGRKKYTINTGYKADAEIQALEDVYLSKALWLLHKGRLIPVSLANKEQLLTDTAEELHSAELELMEGHNGRFV